MILLIKQTLFVNVDGLMLMLLIVEIMKEQMYSIFFKKM